MIRKLLCSSNCAILPVAVLVLLAATDSALCFDASNPCGSSGKINICIVFNTRMLLASQTQLSDITVVTSNSTADEKRAATAHAFLLWPRNVVPYVISPQYTCKTSVKILSARLSVFSADREKRVILQAMSHWEIHTCIRFKERTDEIHYLYFFPGVG